jgi:toxin ParE1/3/4
MARVQWTDPALEHMQEIIAYLARRSRVKAEQTQARILAAVDRLELLPQMGRVVPEFNLDYLRELIVSPYRVLYVHREDCCSIVAVIHSSRDLANLVFPDYLDTNGPPDA